MATVKERAKAAVIRGFNATKSVWIDIELRQRVLAKRDLRNKSNSQPLVQQFKALPTNFEEKQIDGERVRSGDRMLLIDVQNVNGRIDLKDYFYIDGVKHDVLNVKDIYDVIYKVHIRRGG